METQLPCISSAPEQDDNYSIPTEFPVKALLVLYSKHRDFLSSRDYNNFRVLAAYLLGTDMSKVYSGSYKYEIYSNQYPAPWFHDRGGERSSLSSILRIPQWKVLQLAEEIYKESKS